MIGPCCSLAQFNSISFEEEISLTGFAFMAPLNLELKTFHESERLHVRQGVLN